MKLMIVDEGGLQDQADIIFNVADDLLSDQPEIVRLLHGAGNLLIAIWGELDDGNEVKIVKGFQQDAEGDYDSAYAEVDALQRKRNGFFLTVKGINFIEECVTGVTEDLIRKLLVEQSHFFRGMCDPSLIDIAPVCQDDGRAFVIVEDRNYQVDDPEARRTFAMVRATPGLDNTGIDFEEL